MNHFFNLAGTAMPGFSTDQTASSVRHFITQRPSLISRPQTREQPYSAGPPVPLELLYPLLYADRVSIVQRCGDYVRAIALILGRRLSHRSAHAPKTA